MCSSLVLDRRGNKYLLHKDEFYLWESILHLVSKQTTDGGGGEWNKGNNSSISPSVAVILEIKGTPCCK